MLNKDIENMFIESTLVIWLLGLCASTAGGRDSIPGWRSKIP